MADHDCLSEAVANLRAEADMTEMPGRAKRLRRYALAVENAADEVDRLRAEVDVMQRAADYGVTFESKTEAMLAAALHDIAGMRPVIVAGREMWHAEAECSDLRGIPCHALEPDQPENWCPVCVAEVAWCAWKMGRLG